MMANSSTAKGRGLLLPEWTESSFSYLFSFSSED
jgi:hypothetical protein